MKKHFLLLFLGLFFSILLRAQTATQPSIGDGTINNPYQISTLENLYWLATNQNVWSSYFSQTVDIDATATSSWIDGGWKPIGNTVMNFAGHYNGNDFKITSLYLNRNTANYCGLFGIVANSNGIQNLGIEKCDITGNDFVGGLIGYSINNTISNCYSSGTISGNNYTGGIIGYNGSASNISNCYSNGQVTGKKSVIGGFIGCNSNNTVKNCYSKSSVTGIDTIGGFIGKNITSTVNYCYSIGYISGNTILGGLIGCNSGITVLNSFWNTSTSGMSTSAGGVGKTTSLIKTLSTFTNQTWDFVDETTNGTFDYWAINTVNNNGYPYLTWQKYAAILSDNVVNGITDKSANIYCTISTLGTPNPTSYGICWATTGTPTIADQHTDNGTVSVKGTYKINVTGLNANTTYYARAYAINEVGISYSPIITFNSAPIPQIPPSYGDGTSNNPYQIETLENLYWLSQNSSKWSSFFIQTKDIDASNTSLWLNGGWTSIGTSNTQYFNGTYDGQYHTIFGISISPIADYKGLFGWTNGCTISNLGVKDLNINTNGAFIIGGLIAYNQGTITNCYTTGTISSTGTAGGLIGKNYGYLESCFSTVNTSSSSSTGGLIGYNENGTINNCYALGNVTGLGNYNYYTGGLIGQDKKGTVRNCYSTGKVIGVNNVGGFLGYEATSNSVFTNCFWDELTSNQSYSISGTKKSTAEMKTISTFTNASWDFVTETSNGTNDYWTIVDTINNSYPCLSWQLRPKTCIWDGNTWNPRKPVQVDSAIINGDYNNYGFTCKTLDINAGKLFTIATGTTKVKGNLIIKSDSNGTASIIENGTLLVTGSTSVQQYLKSGRNWYTSVPVYSATSSVFKTNANNKLWTYNEATFGWSEITNTTTSLTTMKGYVTNVVDDGIVSFSQKINYGSISINLSRTGTTNSKRGFNLVGNPYPSSLNWELAIKTNIEPTIWYRTKNANNTYVYDSYNADLHVGTNNNEYAPVTQYVPPMQAFWAKVSSDGVIGQLTFDNSMRCHQSKNNLKTDKTTNIIRLNISNGKNIDETIIAFNDNASNNFDRYDSEKMISTDKEIPELYTIANFEKLAINGLANIESNKYIPLGFKTLKAGTFTISAKEISGLDDVTILIEDKELHQIQDLKQNQTYTFNTDSIDNNNRFVIHLKSETVGSTIEQNSFTISQRNNIIIVQSMNNEKGDVKVFDVLGRQIAIAPIVSEKTELELSNTKGTYFVKVENSQSIETKKIIIE